MDTHKAAVARAAQLAGGVQALSRRLRVPVVDLMRWIQGDAKPPMGIFLRVVDFILDQSRKPAFTPVRGERKPAKPSE